MERMVDECYIYFIIMMQGRSFRFRISELPTFKAALRHVRYYLMYLGYWLTYCDIDRASYGAKMRHTVILP